VVRAQAAPETNSHSENNSEISDFNSNLISIGYGDNSMSRRKGDAADESAQRPAAMVMTPRQA
jgi:hypothetical protein